MIKKSIFLTSFIYVTAAQSALVTKTPQGFNYNPSSQRLSLSRPSISYPSRLGDLELLHKDHKFQVKNYRGKLHEVNPYRVSQDLREISTQKLAKYVTAGSYVEVKQNSDGDYEIDLQDRIYGGGPILSQIGYWGTKIGSWGVVTCAGLLGLKTAGAAVAKAVPAVANAVAAVPGGGQVAAENMAASAISYATGLAEAPAAAAGAVGAQLEAAGAGESSAIATVAAGIELGAQYVGGLATAIEEISTTVGLICFYLPTP
jgi:hypothetical protein